MPSTRKQMRAAGRELRLRREGKVEREPDAKRPFGGISDENLRKYAGYPKPRQQREAANRELLYRATGTSRNLPKNRAFGREPKSVVEFYATATDDEIRKRNEKIIRD